MYGDKSNTAALILGKLSGSKGEGGEDSESDGLVACMQDFIHALSAKDAKGAAEAFRRCMDCSPGPAEMEMSEGPSEAFEEEG